MGIKQLIDMSKIGQPFQTNMVCAAIRYQVPSVNSFIFPFGLYSITLLYVFMLMGLLVVGPYAPYLIDSNDNKLPNFLATSTNYSLYHSLIQHKVKASGAPFEKEYIEFFWVLICKYLICPFSRKPVMEYIYLARVVVS